MYTVPASCLTCREVLQLPPKQKDTYEKDSKGASWELSDRGHVTVTVTIDTDTPTPACGVTTDFNHSIVTPAYVPPSLLPLIRPDWMHISRLRLWLCLQMEPWIEYRTGIPLRRHCE